MKTGKNGIELIQAYEGLRLEAYLDQRNIPTIGWGHTGPEVHLGLVWTKEKCDEVFAEDLNKFELGVMSGINNSVVTQNQFDAMVSLTYNIGVGGFASSTVARQHRIGNYQGAAKAFELWDKVTNPSTGQLEYSEPHHKRRVREANLYLTPDSEPLPLEAKPVENTIKKAIAKELQIVLYKFKLYEGQIDGIWGPMSKAAYQKFLDI